MAKYSGIAASVPKVPGAIGAKPEPKPNDRKWTGLSQEIVFNSGRIANLGKVKSEIDIT